VLGEIGHILLGLALATTLYGTGATLWAIRQGDRRWAASGRNGVYAATGLLALAQLALLVAFLNNQFGIAYVARHSSRALPLYLKVSAVWAGQEGSLLLWAFLQALFAALVAQRHEGPFQSLIPWTTVFLSLITAFFVAMTLLLSNPFIAQVPPPADGLGLNPLLRHPGMIFHPPAMYVGYVGLAVPFALALAGLMTRQVDTWPAAARGWTLLAWLFLGIGLLLGARWAYDVLGWGGYWAWDPVENAGLMPWLTATALLHGLVMQQEGRGFRAWNFVLATLSFALVLFGTFTTRSGLIQSVHAFARSNLGPYFLGAIALTLLGALALLLQRRSLISDAGSELQLLSREGLFFLTLVLLLTITASVFVGSVLPTLTEALSGQRFEAGPAWFDRVTGPQFAALVLVLGVCPLLGRSVGALRRLRHRGWIPLVVTLILTGLAAVAGFTRWPALVGIALATLAGSTAVLETAHGAVTRGRRRGENPLAALGRLVARQRRRYGGYLVHLGVALMAVGVVGTRVYPFEEELVLTPEEPARVEDYVLTYHGLGQLPEEDHLTTWANVTVQRGGDQLATLWPQMDRYPTEEQNYAIPAVRAGLREDLYLVLAGWSVQGQTVTLKVFINRLASFLWLGGLVFLSGGVVAMWPTFRGTQVTARRRAPRRAIANGVAIAAGLIILAWAGWALWGPAPPPVVEESPVAAAEANRGGRLRPGDEAPGFTLPLLDGSQLAFADLEGQITVLNFWAPWCGPCEEELPYFQSIWEENQRRVIFVGVTFPEDEDETLEMVNRLGVSYPIGLDVDGRLSEAYGITGVPETFIVDEEGRVAHVHVGPVEEETLRAELERLLE
jgi:cytochrome c-type biogenesis protein CcmF